MCFCSKQIFHLIINSDSLSDSPDTSSGRGNVNDYSVIERNVYLHHQQCHISNGKVSRRFGQVRNDCHVDCRWLFCHHHHVLLLLLVLYLQGDSWQKVPTANDTDHTLHSASGEQWCHRNSSIISSIWIHRDMHFWCGIFYCIPFFSIFTRVVPYHCSGDFVNKILLLS